MDYSLLIPIHNESQNLLPNITSISKYMDQTFPNKSFEIILIENPGNLNTTKIQNIVLNKKVRYHSITKRGIGLAIKHGIHVSIGEYLMFYAVDCPFGLDIIGDSFKIVDKTKYDLIIGSKGHVDSIYKDKLTRKIYSKTANYMVRLLFNVPIRDTQGSFAISRKNIEKLFPVLTSSNPWFQAQLTIHAHINGYKILELPVKYVNNSGIKRKSRFKKRDSLIYIFEMLYEFIKLRLHY